MRTLTFAAFFAGLAVAAAPAEAQRLGSSGQATTSRQGGWNTPRSAVPRSGAWYTQRSGSWNAARQSRWGNKVNGHWYAGHNAPGGWQGYRRPYRGWTLPRYWIAPSFFVGDYSFYGLSTPPHGYNWTRYYDDAVLTDSRGQVWDTVSGVDWDHNDTGYDDGYYADDGYDRGGQGYYERRDDGVGGAVVGGVVGGVAGNLIAGRGNRLAGTLIGAGVGAAAGYVIDRAEDRGRYPAPPPQGYSNGYGAGYAPPPVAYAPPREVVQGGGYSSGYHQQQGGYASGGYWYPPATTTTVTIASAPVETVTTTTEYIEETTSYSTPRKVWRPAPKKKVWKPAPHQCACNCGC